MIFYHQQVPSGLKFHYEYFKHLQKFLLSAPVCFLTSTSCLHFPAQGAEGKRTAGQEERSLR